jgi:2'-5' RNA ligase
MVDTMETFRGFIAVEVPVTDQMVSFQKDIKKTNANVKLVEPENIHITLKFLGDVPVSEIETIESMMKQSVESIQPHSIMLKGTGVFPNENYIKVIWIGIQGSDHLYTIAHFLNQQSTKIGVKKEKRGFSAHLTIGRMKSAYGKEHILSLIKKYEETIFSEIPVNQIHLKKSTLTPRGPIYETLSNITIND